MKESLLQYLGCGRCRSPYGVSVNRRRGSEILSGTLACRCPASIPVVRGVPRFVASDLYTRSFSFEWGVFRKTQIERFHPSSAMRGATRRELLDNLDFPPERLNGKLVLDAGCGPGRFTDLLLEYGATVVACDLSRAIDVAYEHFSDSPRAHLLQGDLFHLPLRHGMFDFILSMGVLHHTPDPSAAFRSLLPFLREEGKMSIRVYNDGYRHGINDRYRRITRRLPSWLLFLLCTYSIPWHFVARAPLVGRVLRKGLLHLYIYDWKWRFLDTFDFFSPWHQFYYSAQEIQGWYEAAGLTDIRQTSGGDGNSFIGRRPVQSVSIPGNANPAAAGRST